MIAWTELQRRLDADEPLDAELLERVAGEDPERLSTLLDMERDAQEGPADPSELARSLRLTEAIVKAFWAIESANPAANMAEFQARIKREEAELIAANPDCGYEELATRLDTDPSQYPGGADAARAIAYNLRVRLADALIACFPNRSAEALAQEVEDNAGAYSGGPEAARMVADCVRFRVADELIAKFPERDVEELANEVELNADTYPGGPQAAAKLALALRVRIGMAKADDQAQPVVSP